jgi:transposase
MKYAGIDLHSNNCVVSVVDETDRVVIQRRLPNDLAQVISLLKPYQQTLGGVVVESTFNWYWLVDGLMAEGLQVHLANPAAIGKYSGLKHADDEADARHLAQLLRLGILPTGFIYPPEQRAARDLGRQRMSLVQARSRAILSIESIWSRHTGGRLSSNQVKQLDCADIESMVLHPDVRLAIQAQHAVIEALNQQIDALEKRLLQRMRAQASYRWLMTVPGIGATLATVIALETGPIERFTTVGDYASYARCVSSVHLSNGKKKGAGNVKNGNRYLAWAFVEAAQFARRFSAEAKRFYERKRGKTNTTVATKALAHKLARACYHMMKQGAPFNAARCFS